jgi:hypothetical protein
VDIHGPQTATTYTITDTIAQGTPNVGTRLFTGNGNDTVDVLGTHGFLIVDTQNSQGTVVNVGNAHSVQGILGAMEVDSNTGNLVLDDSADKIGRSVTISDETVQNLAPAPIRFSDEGIRPSFKVTVDGGGGNNRFDVQAIRPDVHLNIAVGDGNNTLNVVSSGFSLDTIQGPLSFHGGAGSNTLNVNDQAAASGETYTIQPTSVLRLGSTGTPATINFDASVKALTVNGTNTGFTNGVFNVVDTPKNAVTTLNTGSDNSTVNIEVTTGALVINAVGGAQHVNIGLNNSVQGIKGAVTLSNSIGETTLAVFDAAGPAAPTVTMGVNAQHFGFLSGLAPATILYAQNDVSLVDVHGPQSATTYTITDTAKSNKVSTGTLIFAGNGNNTFNVQKTTGSLEIVDGGGKDTINIGSTAHTLDTIQGVVSVQGGFGFDTLNINDQGSKTPHTYFQGVGVLRRNGAADIFFSHIASLHVNKGPVVGSPPKAKGLKLTHPAKGRRRVTLTGQLTDADPSAKLTLTVDWGDDSLPQTIQPSQLPFKVKHHYAKKGGYTVRVVWTDLKTHESNSQDLRVNIA